MGCGCRNKGNNSKKEDLEKYAFLTPKQLRQREEQRRLNAPPATPPETIEEE